MTAPAFDIKPEAPRRTEIDPFITAAIIYDGRKMVDQEAAFDDPPASLDKIIWRLIQEAVECDRVIAKPGPYLATRSGPQVFYTRSEIWAVELQWAAENIVYTPKFFREMPSAAAHQRYLEVMQWLRFITAKSKDRKTFVRMLFALALGMPPARAADAFPRLFYSNGDAVWAAKHRAVRQIAGRLREACKSIDLAA